MVRNLITLNRMTAFLEADVQIRIDRVIPGDILPLSDWMITGRHISQQG